MNPEEWGAIPVSDRGVLSPSGTVGVRPNAQAALDPTAWGAVPVQDQPSISPNAERIIERRGKEDQMLATMNPVVGAIYKILPRETVEQGLTFGFSDELTAGLRTLLGDNYDEALAAERERLARTRKERPVASVAGEVTGALLTTPLAPAANVLRGANVLSRAANAATTGAAYGGLYGFGAGEGGVENRAANAVNTGAFGAIAGGFGAPLVEGVVAGANALARPLRGMLNPEAEATRRVAGAIQRDNPNTPNAPAVAANALEDANTAGVPAVVGDMGGSRTLALARSAADTSPEARGALQNAVNDRFEGQSDRVGNVVRSIIGGDPNAAVTREALTNAARTANRPAYQRAYAQGNSVWDETLQSLAEAPAMQNAMRTAGVTGRNRAVADGFPPVRNPFVTDPATGRLVLRQGPNGETNIPNLQFWDHVKRELDKVGTGEARSLAEALRNHLDELVPAYREARAGAAAAFGGQDALEAGQQFVMSSMPLNEARRAHAQLSPAERRLFAQGFASDLLDKIAKVGDRRNIINSIFGSPDSRARMQLALGPQGAARLEAAARIENILDRLRTATQGNSRTAQYLADLGIAGGTGAVGLLGGFDPSSTGGAALAAILLRRGASAGVARIDQRVAQRVGEMLASNDPNILRNAYDMIARSRGLMEVIRAVENDISRGAIPNAPQGIVPRNVLPAAAEQDQNNVPR